MTSRKILVQTTKPSSSPKISDFQNGAKSPWCLTKEYTGFLWYIFSRICPWILSIYGKCRSEKTCIFAYIMQCPTESIGKLRYNILLQCTCKILRMKCADTDLLHWHLAVHFFDTFIGQKYWIYWISAKLHRIQIDFWYRYQIWTN